MIRSATALSLRLLEESMQIVYVPEMIHLSNAGLKSIFTPHGIMPLSWISENRRRYGTDNVKRRTDDIKRRTANVKYSSSILIRTHVRNEVQAKQRFAGA